MDVQGAKAVVVGGASGMGRATAERLAAAGASVAVLDREQSDGQEVAKAFGGSFHAVDVTDFAAAERALQDAVDALGGLHIAVTTAGGGIGKRTLGKDGSPHDLESFRSVLDLNIVATFNLNRLSAVHMSRNEPVDEERGVIINTSSIAGFEGQIGQVAYSAAKAAIAGMSLTMARDLGVLGIRVLAIAPSLFATGAVTLMPEEMIPPLVAGNAFPKRMGRADEYAKLALAIIDNQMLNGQCLRLDAGMRFAPK
jgi:NAD(P)-dependent dehydrogenase (short-subunit alcohol dehydrogenase family)